MKEQAIQVGGQAVIEGVMMRSAQTVSVAVRRQDGSILVRKKPFVSFIKRFKILSFPILRGSVVLIESLVLGIKALTFSGDVAVADEKKKEPKNNHKDAALPAKKGWLASV